MCAIAASVGLSLFQGLAMRSAATQAAEDTAEIERQGVKSAEDAKRNKQLALAERKQEETVAARQDQFAKRIDTLVATKALLAKGQAGNTTNLLVMDQARQGANYNEKIRQSIESMDRQYLFDIKSTEAEKQEAQNVFAKNIEILQAQKALLASGQAGNNINLLFRDLGRQGGNFRESIRQELESFSRQYDRNIQGTESEYQNIRNRLRSNTITAYNQIPSTGSIILGAATSAFNTELSLDDGFFS